MPHLGGAQQLRLVGDVEVRAQRGEVVGDVVDDELVFLVVLARGHELRGGGLVGRAVAGAGRRTGQRERLDDAAAAAHQHLGGGPDEHAAGESPAGRAEVGDETVAVGGTVDEAGGQLQRVDRRVDGQVDGPGQDDLVHAGDLDGADGGVEALEVLLRRRVMADDAGLDLRRIPPVVGRRLQRLLGADDLARHGQGGGALGIERDGADDHLVLTAAQALGGQPRVAVRGQGSLRAHGTVAAGEQEVGGRCGAPVEGAASPADAFVAFRGHRTRSPPSRA